MYRSIYRGLFNKGFTKDNRGARRKFRRKGKSRFLLTSKAVKKDALSILNVIINLFSELPLDKRRTITPDRGSEFSFYQKFNKAVNINCYFSDSQAP